jgi:hypothetical protein
MTSRIFRASKKVRKKVRNDFTHVLLHFWPQKKSEMTSRNWSMKLFEQIKYKDFGYSYKEILSAGIILSNKTTLYTYILFCIDSYVWRFEKEK